MANSLWGGFRLVFEIIKIALLSLIVSGVWSIEEMIRNGALN